MNRPENLERDLTLWLADAATPRVPDFTDDILRLTAATRQRPRWTFPERWLPMSVITLGRRTLSPIAWRTIGLIAVLALLIAAAAAVYIGSQPRLPAPFGVARNGAIVSEQGGDIVRIDPVSGSRSTIIDGPVPAEDEPVHSRDGTHLAFIRGFAGARSLWVSDADGANQRELSTSGLGYFDGVAWSPDGHSIASTTDVNGISSISIIPTDGGAARVLDVGMPTEGAQWRPPDGREILFRGTSPEGFGLFAVRPDGTGLRPVTASNGINEWDALFFDWSPDGTQVAYQWRDGNGLQLIYVVSAEGGTRRALTKVESVGGSWSPDGSKLLFVGFDQGNTSRVSVVASDGSGRMIQGPPDTGSDSVWTPDGTKVLFMGGSAPTFMLLDPATGSTEPASWSLSPPSNPDWQRLAP